MAYQVFARKYRPQTFEEIVGQETIVRTLTNSIRMGRIAQAYLFVGPRGTGKTSTARILAKALNCSGGPRVDFDPNEEVCREIAEGRSLDVLEIDGASNNGVEQVRELRENVRFAPAKGRFKIYVIDEVHMLTQAAFNALLKTLEEPPEHVRFIFATTEGHKIPSTVLSRCQRFDFRKIPVPLVAGHLTTIAEHEGIILHPSAAVAIATLADGSLRDAEVALDQLASFFGNEITEKAVWELFGLPPAEVLEGLAEALIQGHVEEALKLGRKLLDAGKDPVQLIHSLVSLFRNLAIAVLAPGEALRESCDGVEREAIQRLAQQLSRTSVLSYLDELMTWMDRLRYALRRDILFEVALIELAYLKEKVSLETLLQDLAGLPLPKEPSSIPKEPLPKSESSFAQDSLKPTETSLSSARVQSGSSPGPLHGSTREAPDQARVEPTLPQTESKPSRSPASVELTAYSPSESLSNRLSPHEVWTAAVEHLLSIDPQKGALLRERTRGAYLRSEVFDVEILPERQARGKSAGSFMEVKKVIDEVASILQEKIQALCGSPKRIECLFPRNSEKNPETQPKRTASREASRVLLNEEEFRNDPAIEKALELFQARIVAVKELAPEMEEKTTGSKEKPAPDQST